MGIVECITDFEVYVSTKMLHTLNGWVCKVIAHYLSESRITRITRKGFLVHFKFIPFLFIFLSLPTV